VKVQVLSSAPIAYGEFEGKANRHRWTIGGLLVESSSVAFG
jgi:hypothetical protein